MEKKKLETFIKKYHLNGTIESAVWTNEGDDLAVTTVTSSKKLFASVKAKDLAKGFITDVSVGVSLTDRLKKMMSPLGENIAISVDVDPNDSKRVLQIIGDDGRFSFNYQAQELSTMDGIPKLKNIPVFETEITLSPEWIDAYNKSLAAIQNDDTLFTLVMSKSKKKLELVLGYKKGLSDRVTLEVTPVAGKESVKTAISFNAKMLKDVLNANSDVQNPVLKVSEAGLAKLEFENDGIKSEYYLVKIDVED
jgi:hypothetical protein